VTRVVAVVGARWEPNLERELLAPLDVDLRAGTGADGDDLLRVAGDAEVILAGAGPRFDASVLSRLHCRGIVRYGVGTDNIDLEAASHAGMWVARVPDYGTESVAVHAVTLALSATRRLVEADRALREGRWGIGPLRPLHAPSASVAGVVGFGRIGSTVAPMLAALGFSVLVHEPLVRVEGFPSVGLQDLLARADLVTLHAPGAPDGSPLLDRAAIACMRPGSVLVNTARGTLVDQEALVAGLRRRAPAVAALDVFASEPVDPAVFGEVADRVIFTPHMAWYTEESERDLRIKATEEAARLLRGEEPLSAVARPASKVPG
jgi:D-3-phosphoglycerate dehydrogenase